MKKIKEIYLSTYFLIQFNSIKEKPAIRAFLDFLKILINNKENNIERHLETFNLFQTELLKTGFDNFSNYIKTCTIEEISKNNIQKSITEFEIISNLSKISHKTIIELMNKKFRKYSKIINKMPAFKSDEINLENIDFKELIHCSNIKIFEKNKAFIFNDNFEIKPVDYTETITFKDLKEYKEQKKILFENTKALLDGLKVNNILLYGDAGCGKSSSVRALLNEFQELKMVQIFKNNLINFDKLYATLKNLPYKFIIFADDISFDDTDNTFSTMKAILEGSLIQCPKNAAIYATSNRRHLVKESFQARKGDEIHLNDTLNEISSLSERFGINLLFQKPTNDEFIKIVLELAHDNKIDIDDKTLIEKAQKMSIIKGSKSPRIAKQLIDNLLANVSV